jgi:hypothetical protein
MGKHKRVRHVFAVIRWDRYLPVDVPQQITVKMIVPTQQRAETEVERLNALEGSGHSLYFWQLTRVDESLELTSDKSEVAGDD